MLQDKVEECYKLMLEVVSGYNKSKFNKRKFGSIPSSPNGIMEGSFSSDSSNEYWEVDHASVSSSPLSKKTRTQDDQLLLNHSNTEFLSIPR